MRTPHLAAISVALTLCGCAEKGTVHAYTPPAPAAIPVDMKLPDTPKKPELAENEKKLDAPLLGLIAAQRSGSTAQAMKPLDTHEDKVRVEIVAKDAAAVPTLKERLQTIQAEVTATLENHLWAYVPVASLEELSRLDIVWSMTVAQASNSAK